MLIGSGSPFFECVSFVNIIILFEKIIVALCGLNRRDVGKFLKSQITHRVVVNPAVRRAAAPSRRLTPIFLSTDVKSKRQNDWSQNGNLERRNDSFSDLKFSSSERRAMVDS